MQNIADAGGFADCAPQLVLQALLASNLTSFTEFAFGVVRPDVAFKPNWHFEAVTAELKREMGPIAFSAQYQQSPIPPGGTIIKCKWLTPYDDIRT